jgi:hypothetical protein
MRTSRPGISASGWVSSGIVPAGAGAWANELLTTLIPPRVAAEASAAAIEATTPYEVADPRLIIVNPPTVSKHSSGTLAQMSPVKEPA